MLELIRNPLRLQQRIPPETHRASTKKHTHRTTAWQKFCACERERTSGTYTPIFTVASARGVPPPPPTPPPPPLASAALQLRKTLDRVRRATHSEQQHTTQHTKKTPPTPSSNPLNFRPRSRRSLELDSIRVRAPLAETCWQHCLGGRVRVRVRVHVTCA